MVSEKSSSIEGKKKTIFSRLTDKFTSQQRCSTRNQSVQTNPHPQIPTMVLFNTHLNNNPNEHSRILTRRPRSSLKAFLTLNSPKAAALIHRARRCSINLQTPKRLSSDCLQVALVRKIQPVSRFDSSCVLSSSMSHILSKPTLTNETSSSDELLSIGPMKWSTPNRAVAYKTSSPYNNHSGHQHRLCCTVNQLSFSNIFDRTD